MIEKNNITDAWSRRKMQEVGMDDHGGLEGTMGWKERKQEARGAQWIYIRKKKQKKMNGGNKKKKENEQA